MRWTELLFRVVSRRWWALLGLVATVGVVLATPRDQHNLHASQFWEAGVIALVLWAGFLVTWRASDERRSRRRLAEARATWRRDAALFAARVQAFIIPAHDDDGPETDELKATLERRHDALVAAIIALDEGREPAREPRVVDGSSTIERKELVGVALVDRLAGLQRDALVESERRRWLTSGRFTAIEDNLSRLQHTPSPDRAWSTGFTQLSAVAITATAWVLPFVAPSTLAALGVAAFVGLLLIAFDALAD